MRSLIVLGLLLVFACVGVAAGQTVFPYAHRQAVLPNGLKVIMVPIDSPGLVAYYSVVRTGSRDEVEAGKSGFAHFFEHMMFRGTKKYPQDVYNRIVTGMGAQANAFTSDDLTVYHLTFAKEDLEKVIDIESDRFQNLAYGEPAFQTEAGAVYGEYRKMITSPLALLEEKLRDTAFDVHTYKHTTIGFEADIKRMPEAYQYSLSFFKRFYRPENVVVLVVGDIDPAATLKLVQKYYSGWQKSYTPPKIKPEPPQTQQRQVAVTYPGKTLPVIDVAYKGDAFNPANRDYMGAVLLGDLAFGQTSELYQKLVLQEQKVVSLSGDVPMSRDLSLFEIVSMVKDPGDIDYVRDEIYKTLKQFQTTPPDEQRLADLKRHDKYTFLMSLNSPDKVAGAMAHFVSLTGGIEGIDQFFTAMEKVTPADVSSAANKYFVPERRTVAILKGTAQ